MQKRKMYKKLAAALLATTVIGSGTALAAYSMIPGPQADGTGVTTHGWTINPAGTQLNVGNKPFGGVISPDQKYLILSNDGTKKSIQVVDLQQQKVVSEVKMSDLWYGLAFSPDGKTVYASGLKNNIHVFQFENGTLIEQTPIVLKNPNNTKAVFAPGGMSVSADGKFLYVANNMENSTSKIDASTGQIITTTPVGKSPYAAVLNHDNNKLYVSNWGESSITVLNPADLTVEKTIAVGLHPNAIAENPVNGLIYIANSDSDEISVVDAEQQTVIQTLSLAPYSGAKTGTMPNALTVSPDGSTLYVSNAGNNDVAVIDLGVKAQKSVTDDVYEKEPIQSEAKVKGLIPTAWYPSGVYLSGDGKQLMVTNAMGLGYGPNAQKQYIGDIVKGTLSFIDVPDEKQLKNYTKQVEKNNTINEADGAGWLSRLKGNHDHPIPQFAEQHSPIKHVIYVIKENRTYDQVLGDLGKGDGDPSLTEFGKTVTPNIHKLSDQFVTLDNFYGDGDASPVGHYWSMGAQANDHLEKEYRSGGHPYDYEGRDEANYTKGGFLWNNASNHGVSFRDYGEFIIPGANGQWVPSDPSIGNNYDPNFAGWTLNVNDRQRYEEWNKEFQQFEENDNLPQLQVVLMPADHTSGTSKGMPTPQGMVADGDYALGKLVETVSNSKYWKDTAIFVLEDDSQAGADHVDAHRMPALVISPYTQTGKVDSSFYDTTSMVRTMEMILGLKPMSQFDASALPMLNAFTNQPNFDPYQAEAPQYPLDTMNGQNAPMAEISNKMDFSQPDSNDPQQLNRIIWKATKGDQPYPENKNK